MDIKPTRKEYWMRELLPLAGITLVAIFFRFWQLDLIPPGLHHDEAFHAMQARDILLGHSLPIVLPGNFGALPLMAYLTSLSFHFLGQTPLAIRAVSAVVGVLSVPALYLLVRQVLNARSPALLSAFLLAVSFQGTLFSREGLEANLVPLLAILALYFLWRGRRSGERWAFALSGACLGIGFYSYRAFWLFPLVMTLAVVWLALADRGPSAKSGWLNLAILAAVAGIILLPLGVETIQESRLVGERLAMVSVTNPKWAEAGEGDLLAKNVAATVAMFTWQGDPDPRNNLPGRSMLDAFQSLGFLIGLGLCLWRWRKPAYAIWLLWLIVMVLPMTLSEYAPHFRRAIGVLPAVTVLAALGIQGIWDCGLRIADFRARYLRPVLIVLLGMGLVASTVVGFRDYFVLLGPSNDFFYAFDTGLAQMAWYVNGLPPGDRAYYLPADNRHFTLQFLAQGPVPRSFESRKMQVLAPIEDDHATVYVVVSMEDAGALPFLRRAYPGGQVVHEGRDRDGNVYFTAYRVPAGSQPAVTPQNAVTSTLDNAVALIGYDLDTGNKGRVTVTLYWRALRPLDKDYTAFVHLVGKDGLAAQRDAQPGEGSYPTTRWAPGEVIVDHYTLDLSPQTPPGDYDIHVGMYLLATLQRLPAQNEAGARWPNDAVVVEKVRVER